MMAKVCSLLANGDIRKAVDALELGSLPEMTAAILGLLHLLHHQVNAGQLFQFATLQQYRANVPTIEASYVKAYPASSNIRIQ
jgi:hypothetical protein